VPKTTEAKW